MIDHELKVDLPLGSRYPGPAKVLHLVADGAKELEPGKLLDAPRIIAIPDFVELNSPRLAAYLTYLAFLLQPFGPCRSSLSIKISTLPCQLCRVCC